jgi:hypothetical protein
VVPSFFVVEVGGALSRLGFDPKGIGRLVDRYPRHHASLQERIAMEHLVVSPFESGTPLAKWHFPKRNRLMARLARAMVLVEAGAASGTRHQVEECLSLGKPVFIHASLLKDVSSGSTPQRASATCIPAYWGRWTASPGATRISRASSSFSQGSLSATPVDMGESSAVPCRGAPVQAAQRRVRVGVLRQKSDGPPEALPASSNRRSASS